ncbi:hypothetical protein C6P45_002875 [Maudiozyma exigua]|uniref:Micro-fibrillar-associated protein 1 C-terminal domain-containing protein n=1 Tax=Maudiozyma exigua TaxID=34358 RepID=A0A9P7BBA5_MAUEX|nr:hypothetical protein C6P45_002875 [Kazachstania exigua]
MSEQELSDVSNDYESSSESESSSSDDVVTLHKPVFLKRYREKQVNFESDENVMVQPKKKKTEESNNDDSQLMKRIDLENKVATKREEMKSQITNDYTTDKDLLRRTMELNDDDTIDEEYEKKQWQVRNELRQKRHRDELVAKQLAFESMEEIKLRSKDQRNIDLNPN